jgi:hypothetical protein
VRKMVQTARVVVVQVRHHELADVAGYIYAHRRKPRPDLLLRRNPYLHHVLEEGVGARQIIPERVARAVPGVDDEQSFGMLDQIAVDRQRPSSLFVQHDRHLAPRMIQSRDLHAL